MDKTTPFCSVIVLNYFGEKILASALASLTGVNYPKDKYEIIVVDNNSHDKSKEIILHWSKKYPQIKPLLLDKNLGFAGGNNEGIKKALGEYVLLLNNDCIVDKNWLLEMVKSAQEDPRIFAVNSKLLLYPRYIPFSLQLNGSILQAIVLSKSHLLSYIPKIHIPWDLNNDKTSYEGQIVYDPLRDDYIEMSFKCYRSKKSLRNKRVALSIGGRVLMQRVLSQPCRNGVYKFKLQLTEKMLQSSLDKIQNAGIVVFQDGAGRDVGVVVTNQTQNYEIDCGQYNKAREVYAACAAAVLYRKSILNKIGLLDDSFFMYYEDVEICERARLAGYKVVYCPTALVRHLHALSSKEWSTFFIYHSERGRLLHILYHFPFVVFLSEYLGLVVRVLLVVLRLIKGLRDFEKVSKFALGWYYSLLGVKVLEPKKKTDFGKMIAYLYVMAYFMLLWPILIFKKYQKYLNIKYKAGKNIYRSILEGGWYFD